MTRACPSPQGLSSLSLLLSLSTHFCCLLMCLLLFYPDLAWLLFGAIQLLLITAAAGITGVASSSAAAASAICTPITDALFSFLCATSGEWSPKQTSITDIERALSKTPVSQTYEMAKSSLGRTQNGQSLPLIRVGLLTWCVKPSNHSFLL